eukprot:CAMPEP_0114527220 /NCGR_PEP_ID=MMETSP0109-20121206/23489_1 /TAXON_ID=29199 /ORGANISM="Chlorarachnion reptans, Strain CCCM449" /LENGTH=273 /DNA_ID=CAMNT_0001709149 /DNA_START=52 /DNA_END=870 /DNA_ORIENTATION=+
MSASHETGGLKCSLCEYLSGVLVEKAMDAFVQVVDRHVKATLKRECDTPFEKKNLFQKMKQDMKKRLEDIEKEAKEKLLDLERVIKECKDAKWPEAFAESFPILMSFLVPADVQQSLQGQKLLEKVEEMKLLEEVTLRDDCQLCNESKSRLQKLRELLKTSFELRRKAKAMKNLMDAQTRDFLKKKRSSIENRIQQKKTLKSEEKRLENEKKKLKSQGRKLVIEKKINPSGNPNLQSCNEEELIKLNIENLEVKSGPKAVENLEVKSGPKAVE